MNRFGVGIVANVEIVANGVAIVEIIDWVFGFWEAFEFWVRHWFRSLAEITHKLQNEKGT